MSPIERLKEQESSGSRHRRGLFPSIKFNKMSVLQTCLIVAQRRLLTCTSLVLHGGRVHVLKFNEAGRYLRQMTRREEPPGQPIYGSFFGLRERPFTLTPNPRFLYLSTRQREALSSLRYGLSTHNGFTLLTGRRRMRQDDDASRRAGGAGRFENALRGDQQPNPYARGVLRVFGSRALA